MYCLKTKILPHRLTDYGEQAGSLAHLIKYLVALFSALYVPSSTPSKVDFASRAFGVDKNKIQSSTKLDVID